MKTNFQPVSRPQLQRTFILRLSSKHLDYNDDGRIDTMELTLPHSLNQDYT